MNAVEIEQALSELAFQPFEAGEFPYSFLAAFGNKDTTLRLHNLNRVKLEGIFHRLFGAVQLDLTIEDRFGHPVKPREWFLVPLHVIDEAVQCLHDGSIAQMVYDPKRAMLATI